MTPQSVVLTAYEYIYMFTTCFLLFLYIIFIITLIKFRKTDLSSAFYKLFLFLSLCDVTRVVIWTIGYDLPRWNVFQSFYKGSKHFATITCAAYGFCLQLSRILNVLLGINRLTCLGWPFLYDTWWSGHTIFRSVLGSFIVAAALNSHYWIISVVHGTSYIEYHNGTALINLMANPANKPATVHYKIWFATNLVESVVVIPIYIGLYGVMFWKAYKNQKKVSPTPRATGTGPTHGKKKSTVTQARYKSDLKLAFSMFFLCLFQMALSIHMILPIFFLEQIVSDIYMYYVRVSAIFMLDSLLNPVLLLAMSSVARKCLKNVFK